MSYSEAIAYLYSRLPAFHRVGAKAIKPGLRNIQRLCGYLGNPQDRLICVHVGGTNGKGSSSHLLAAILQSAGYRTGLCTSPHLKSFTERIRVNGQPIPEEEVASFVTAHYTFFETLAPSFFEVSISMAFDYFARSAVDIAIIEVGLGGRLDSTNLITPLVSLITNIGWDHSDVLGDTLEKIAIEKAGIIKPGVPVVISERSDETDVIFERQAAVCGSELIWALDHYKVMDQGIGVAGRRVDVCYLGKNWGQLTLGLLGDYQLKNTAGVLATIKVLQRNFTIEQRAIEIGFEQVVGLTGLKGRWQVLSKSPLIICDTAHNEPGIRMVMESISQICLGELHLILGFVRDKDLSRVVALFPPTAHYYFCEPTIPRAMNSDDLQQLFANHGRKGEAVQGVVQALNLAKSRATVSDCILITGSTYLVAELTDI